MSRSKAVRAKISGRVQGVGFRGWTQAEARGRGLGGWVRNDPGGSVTAHLEGTPEAVEDMLAALRKGPPASVVREVTVHDATPRDTAHFDVAR